MNPSGDMWHSRRVEGNKKLQQCCSWPLSFHRFSHCHCPCPQPLFSLAVTWKELHYFQHLFLRDRRHADVWLRITESLLCLRWLLAPEARWPSPSYVQHRDELCRVRECGWHEAAKGWSPGACWRGSWLPAGSWGWGLGCIRQKSI